MLCIISTPAVGSDSIRQMYSRGQGEVIRLVMVRIRVERVEGQRLGSGHGLSRALGLADR